MGCIAWKTRRKGSATAELLHKVSTQIAKNHGIVVLEDLQTRSMTASAKGTTAAPGRRCVACGHTDDADIKAAVNVLRRGTSSMPGEVGGRTDREPGTSLKEAA